MTFYIGELDEPNPAARARYFRDVVRRIEEVPGVVRAGATDYAPFQGEDDFMGFRLPDRSPPETGRWPREEWRRVTEGFFDAAGIAIRRGRGFEAPDYDVSPAVAIINEAFAEKYWPSWDSPREADAQALSAYGLLEIVGVVEDVPERGPALPPPPTFFVPLQGSPRDNMAIFVRFEGGEPLESLEAVKEEAWSVDSSQPIDRVFPVSTLLESTVALPRLARKLLAQFAGIALALGALGLFGVSSYAVRARRPELGIRLALGATPRRLQRHLVTEPGAAGLDWAFYRHPARGRRGVRRAGSVRRSLSGRPLEPRRHRGHRGRSGPAFDLRSRRAIARINPSRSIRARSGQPWKVPPARASLRVREPVSSTRLVPRRTGRRPGTPSSLRRCRRVEHRTSAVAGKSVAVNPDQVDVARSKGEAFFEDPGAFIDEGEDAALDNLVSGERAALDAELPRHALDEERNLGIGDGRAAAFLVAIEARAGLLPEPSELANPIGNRGVPRNASAAPPPGAFGPPSRCPARRGPPWRRVPWEVQTRRATSVRILGQLRPSSRRKSACLR